MKRIVLLAVLALMPAWAHAATRELAADYVELSRIEQIWASTIDRQLQELASTVPAETRAGFTAYLKPLFDWKLIQDEVMQVVQDQYSDDELRAVIQFMRTPQGASFTAKSVSMSARLSDVMLRRMKVALGMAVSGQDKP